MAQLQSTSVAGNLSTTGVFSASSDINLTRSDVSPALVFTAQNGLRWIFTGGGNYWQVDLAVNSSGLLTMGGQPVATRNWVQGLGYITGYTETDTLATVTGRGASTTTSTTLGGGVTLGSRTNSSTYGGNTTGLTLNSVAELRSAQASNPPALTWHYENLATRHILMNSAGTLNVVSPSSENGGVAVLAVNGNTVWHAGNLTNLNQLSNGPGYITSSSNISGAAARLSARDIRTISPSSENAAELRFGFTSWANNNTAPWADFLHLRSYSDNTGGSDNLVMFLKSGIGMRIYQQSFGSGTAYSSFVDVLHSGNFSSFAVPVRGLSNWNDSTVIDDVIGLMAWKNYGNNHVIFDASQSTAPNGTSINNTNSQVAWTGSYPTLMGWNGSNTYGVRVDSARVADGLASMNISQFTNNSGYVTGGPYLPLSGGTLTGTLGLPNAALISVNNEPDVWGARFRTTASTTNLGAALKNIIWTGGGTTEGFAVTGSGTGGAAFEVRNDGIVWARSQMRAPIFFDSDNTGFYLDPAGYSNLRAVGIDGYTQFGITLADPGANFGNYRRFVRVWPTSGGARIMSFKITISGTWNWSPVFGLISADVSFYFDGSSLHSSSTTITSATGPAQSNLNIGAPVIENGFVSVPVFIINSNPVHVKIEGAPSFDWNNVSVSSAQSVSFPGAAVVSVPGSMTVGGSTVVTNNGGTWGINVTGTAASETLATVTGRGASTSTNLSLTGNVGIGGQFSRSNINHENQNNFHRIAFWDLRFWDWDTGNDIFTLGQGDGNVRVTNSLLIAGNTAWHAGNLTNLNQLTNGPGYITGESDTLGSVVSRGRSAGVGFTSYTPDGLFGSGAAPVSFGTPHSSATLIGYHDGGGGQYAPAIGFLSTGFYPGLGALRFRVSGEGNDRCTIYHGGIIAWGPGGSSGLDTNLYRDSANVLRTDDDFYVGGQLRVTAADSDVRTNRGRFQVYNNAGTGNLGYRIRTDDNGGWRWQFVDGGNGEFFGVDYPSGNVSVSGNMGIGTGSPASRLSVTTASSQGVRIDHTFDQTNLHHNTLWLRANNNGSEEAASIGFTVVNNGGDHHRANIVATGNSGVAGGNLAFYTRRNDNAQDQIGIYINNIGNVAILHTSPSYALDVVGTIYASADVIAYSDARVKTNIRPIEKPVERLLKSRGVLYDRIDTEDKNNIGFIAQELEQEFPELVTTGTDGKKAVKYQNMVAVLTEAIKQQQKQIEELKTKLDALT